MSSGLPNIPDSMKKTITTKEELKKLLCNGETQDTDEEGNEDNCCAWNQPSSRAHSFSECHNFLNYRKIACMFIVFQ